MATNAQTELETLLKDNENARSREVALNNSAEAGWLSKNTASIIALSLFGVTILLYILLFTGCVTQTELVKEALWALRDMDLLIIGYYFGSSIGSARKQSMIEKMPIK